jgi:ketosteroid isomerase-like protein
MSRENVEVMRAVFGFWNAGDLDAIEQFLDPSVELVSPLSSVAGESYRGYAGVKRWQQDVYEQFVAWRLTVEQLREVDNHVIAIGHIALQGRSSGVSIDQQTAWVADFGADHRMTRMSVYLSADAALKTVGLEE